QPGGECLERIQDLQLVLAGDVLIGPDQQVENEVVEDEADDGTDRHRDGRDDEPTTKLGEVLDERHLPAAGAVVVGRVACAHVVRDDGHGRETSLRREVADPAAGGGRAWADRRMRWARARPRACFVPRPGGESTTAASRPAPVRLGDRPRAVATDPARSVPRGGPS